MNITPTHSFYNVKLIKKNNEQKQESTQTTYTTNPNFELRAKFNDHLLSFGAQVDKGLGRFYETNKDRMPITVYRYVSSIEDKSRLTPLEAQQRAFSKLNDAKTIQDIKQDFPDEELFNELTEASKTKAKRGILQSVKENEELLKLSDQGILKDKSDLTVYLVKKIFLEGKTIDEINEDLENDLDEDFKADFKFKNKDKESESKYVYGSTLKALGIKTPAFEYQQSLRYTREGYSDAVGESIKKGLREFWDSLDDEERTAKAKKSVEKFENWWDSIPLNKKLEMIADDVSSEEMLKSFKKTQKSEEKTKAQTETKTLPEEKDKTTRKHVKVGSDKLSKDELFKKWATIQLKNYEASLTEAEKDSLHIKRMQRLTTRWSSMSPEERTDYISKMKAGSEPLRYTMIDAWNHSTDLIKDLSTHLKKNQIYKPADLLYSTQEFSQFQSQVMSEFWAEHQNYAAELGEKIIESQNKIKEAIASGTFEALKKQIMRDKNQRIKEMNAFNAQQNKIAEKEKNIKENEKPYVKEFKEAYMRTLGHRLKVLPNEYIDDFMDVIANDMDEEQIKTWTKNLNGEKITPEEQKILQSITQTEPVRGARINRAIEAAGATILYECTRNPEVFLMSHSDVKTALYKLDKGDNPIELGSLKYNRDFQIPVIKNKFSKERLSNLYRQFKEDITPNETNEIVDYYFTNYKTYDQKLNEIIQNSCVPITINGNNVKELKEYLSLYGKSLSIIFSEKSEYPKAVKKAFYEKLKANAPASLNKSFEYCFFEKQDAFEKEEKIKAISYLYQNRFYFVPRKYLNAYCKEMAKELRNIDSMNIYDIFEKQVCTKRKNTNENHKLTLIQKATMSPLAKYTILITEQALADALYEATGDVSVYQMEIEELCDNIELFNLVKKFPSEPRNYTSQSQEKPISLVAKKKINTTTIEKRIREYTEEVTQWLDENKKSPENLYAEDLLYILNPDENMPEKDAAVSARMKKYALNLK